jgi:putative membrane protein
VAGFKAVISSGDFGFMWENAAVLAGFIGVLMAGTWGTLLQALRRWVD